MSYLMFFGAYNNDSYNLVTLEGKVHNRTYGHTDFKWAWKTLQAGILTHSFFPVFGGLVKAGALSREEAWGIGGRGEINSNRFSRELESPTAMPSFLSARSLIFTLLPITSNLTNYIFLNFLFRI